MNHVTDPGPNTKNTHTQYARIQRGVRGKSQFIWVSIGNSQLDPHPLWKKLDPPPLGKWWTPSGTLDNYSSVWNQPLNFNKINWGQKKTPQLFMTDGPGPSWRKLLEPCMHNWSNIKKRINNNRITIMVFEKVIFAKKLIDDNKSMNNNQHTKS